MDVQTQTEHSTAVAQRTTTTTKRGTKINRLRAYLKAGRHLRDDTRGLSRGNVKTQREIARDVGLSNHIDVCYLIRREFPVIAAVMSEWDRNPDQRPSKKEELFQYVADHKHLRDSDKPADARNLRTQKEIAADIGTTDSLISKYMREYYPDIAAIMTERGRRYRDHATH